VGLAGPSPWRAIDWTGSATGEKSQSRIGLRDAVAWSRVPLTVRSLQHAGRISRHTLLTSEGSAEEDFLPLAGSGMAEPLWRRMICLVRTGEHEREDEDQLPTRGSDSGG
jgi:hypothetical protein